MLLKVGDEQGFLGGGNSRTVSQSRFLPSVLGCFQVWPFQVTLGASTLADGLPERRCLGSGWQFLVSWVQSDDDVLQSTGWRKGAQTNLGPLALAILVSSSFAVEDATLEPRGTSWLHPGPPSCVCTWNKQHVHGVYQEQIFSVRRRTLRWRWRRQPLGMASSKWLFLPFLGHSLLLEWCGWGAATLGLAGC